MFATSASIQASWQVSLACVQSDLCYSDRTLLTANRSLTPGLINGGTGGVFWSFIFTAIFALSNVFSIAEYTSMSVERSALVMAGNLLDTVRRSTAGNITGSRSLRLVIRSR